MDAGAGLLRHGRPGRVRLAFRESSAPVPYGGRSQPFSPAKYSFHEPFVWQRNRLGHWGLAGWEAQKLSRC